MNAEPTVITADEYRALLKRGNKYSAQRVERHGQHFDSILEADVYDVLLLLEHAGRIADLRRQCRYELSPKRRGKRAMRLTLDFGCTVVAAGKWIVIDSKGYSTRDWQVRARWFQERYPDMPLFTVGAPAEVIAVVERVERGD